MMGQKNTGVASCSSASYRMMAIHSALLSAAVAFSPMPSGLVPRAVGVRPRISFITAQSTEIAKLEKQLMEAEKLLADLKKGIEPSPVEKATNALPTLLFGIGCFIVGEAIGEVQIPPQQSMSPRKQ